MTPFTCLSKGNNINNSTAWTLGKDDSVFLNSVFGYYRRNLMTRPANTHSRFRQFLQETTKILLNCVCSHIFVTRTRRTDYYKISSDVTVFLNTGHYPPHSYIANDVKVDIGNNITSTNLWTKNVCNWISLTYNSDMCNRVLKTKKKSCNFII